MLRSLQLDGRDLATHPTFDAVCRVAGITPDVLIESSAPSNLLALCKLVEKHLSKYFHMPSNAKPNILRQNT